MAEASCAGTSTGMTGAPQANAPTPPGKPTGSLDAGRAISLVSRHSFKPSYSRMTRRSARS